MSDPRESLPGGFDEEMVGKLLEEIDSIARDYDHWEFGLPLSDDAARENMQAAVRRALDAARGLTLSVSDESEKEPELLKPNATTGDLLESLARDVMRLEAENALLRNVASVVAFADRTRGYPTPRDWNEIVGIAKAALEGK